MGKNHSGSDYIGRSWSRLTVSGRELQSGLLSKIRIHAVPGGAKNEKAQVDALLKIYMEPQKHPTAGQLFSGASVSIRTIASSRIFCPLAATPDLREVVVQAIPHHLAE